MAEQIIIYHESDFTEPIIAPRDEVYSQRGEKYGEYYIAVVDAFVFNSQGEMLLQRRAKHKKTSPGLLHTAVAWHIDPGDTAEFTLLHECLEEIGVPCWFSQEGESFFEQVKKLKPFLEKMAFLKLHKHYRKDFAHVDQNYSFLSRDDTHTFFAVFNGIPVCIDGSVEEFLCG